MTLPAVFRRFLERSLPNPPMHASGSFLSQHGEIALSPGKFVPFTAEQTFEAERCGFVWHARVRMAPLVTAVVEDAYEDGHGRLEAKVFGVLRVAKGTPGVDLDRGELLRYLAELPWNPLALLRNPELRFAESPDGTPRVWAKNEATFVDCTFDDDGDLVAIRAPNRMREGSGPCAWSGRFLRYAELGGARIPVEAEVAWEPPSGREVYWRGQVDEFGFRDATAAPRE